MNPDPRTIGDVLLRETPRTRPGSMPGRCLSGEHPQPYPLARGPGKRRALSGLGGSAGGKTGRRGLRPDEGCFPLFFKYNNKRAGRRAGAGGKKNGRDRMKREFTAAFLLTVMAVLLGPPPLHKLDIWKEFLQLLRSGTLTVDWIHPDDPRTTGIAADESAGLDKGRRLSRNGRPLKRSSVKTISFRSSSRWGKSAELPGRMSFVSPSKGAAGIAIRRGRFPPAGSSRVLPADASSFPTCPRNGRTGCGRKSIGRRSGCSPR